jgi:VanZ family protein
MAYAVIREKLQRISYLAAIWLFGPGLALVVWGELSPSAGDPFGRWDKLLHFTAYFGLAGMAALALRGGRRMLWAGAGLILLGGALEIIQGMTGRDMSFHDEIANTLGVLAGLAASWLYLRLLGSGRGAGRLVGGDGAD